MNSKNSEFKHVTASASDSVCVCMCVCVCVCVCVYIYIYTPNNPTFSTVTTESLWAG